MAPFLPVMEPALTAIIVSERSKPWRNSMANPILKPSLSTRTLQFGSNFAAGALMLSRMNRSEISRFDDLVSDLCRMRTESGKRSDEHRRSELARAARKR